MNIHVLQHVPFEGPGIITDWCRSHRHHLSTSSLYSPDHRLPSADAVDMLIIMGGPMSVYDDDIYPWLKEDGLRQMVQEGLPELQAGVYIQPAEVLLNNPSFETAHPIMLVVLDHLSTFVA